MFKSSVILTLCFLFFGCGQDNNEDLSSMAIEEIINEINPLYLECENKEQCNKPLALIINKSTSGQKKVACNGVLVENNIVATSKLCFRELLKSETSCANLLAIFPDEQNAKTKSQTINCEKVVFQSQDSIHIEDLLKFRLQKSPKNILPIRPDSFAKTILRPGLSTFSIRPKDFSNPYKLKVSNSTCQIMVNNPLIDPKNIRKVVIGGSLNCQLGNLLPGSPIFRQGRLIGLVHALAPNSTLLPKGQSLVSTFNCTNEELISKNENEEQGNRCKHDFETESQITDRARNLVQKNLDRLTNEGVTELSQQSLKAELFQWGFSPIGNFEFPERGLYAIVAPRCIKDKNAFLRKFGGIFGYSSTAEFNFQHQIWRITYQYSSDDKIKFNSIKKTKWGGKGKTIMIPKFVKDKGKTLAITTFPNEGITFGNKKIKEQLLLPVEICSQEN